MTLHYGHIHSTRVILSYFRWYFIFYILFFFSFSLVSIAHFNKIHSSGKCILEYANFKRRISFICLRKRYIIKRSRQTNEEKQFIGSLRNKERKRNKKKKNKKKGKMIPFLVWSWLCRPLYPIEDYENFQCCSVARLNPDDLVISLKHQLVEMLQ